MYRLVDHSTFDEIIVQRGLDNYNHDFGYGTYTTLVAYVRDDTRDIIGGVYGELAFDWLYVDLLWVDEAFQGRGYGRRRPSTRYSTLARWTTTCRSTVGPNTPGV